MRSIRYSLFMLLFLLQLNLDAQHQKIKPPANASNRFENAAVKSSLQQIPVSFEIPAGGNPGDPNTIAVHEPMPFITTAEARAIKAEKLLDKRYNENYEHPTHTARVTPVIDEKFAANVSVDETPSSNSIAISHDGILISANNDGVIYFNDAGSQLYGAKWDDFFDDNTLTASFFSPRVLFDPVEERFIMVVLHGKTPATSRVVLSFSKTKNPADGWNVYKLPGNAHGDGSWIDFSSLGISTNEVYVSGNLIQDTTFNQAIVHQINKGDGYAGTALDWQFWTDFLGGPVSITPASYGHDGDYGPGIYLVSSAAAGDTDYWFWELTDDIGGEPELIGYIIPSEDYGPPADASQSGTTDKLETGDSRTTDAFYLDGIIHFVLNIDIGGGFSGISYNRLSVPQQNVTTTHFGAAGEADKAHAGLASFATSASDRSVMISYLQSGAAIFPEFEVVNVDGGMSWSAPTIVKSGETFVDRRSGKEPWGTYTGMARRHNSTSPRTWTSGSIGANVDGLDHTYETWIGEVTNGQNVGTTDIGKSLAFNVLPNPVRDYMEISFTITEAFPMTIALYDAAGGLVKTLYQGTPLIGLNKFSFQRVDLPVGAYVISVSSLGRMMGWEKIVVVE